MIAATLYTFNKTEVFTAYAKIRMLRDDPSALGQGVYEVGTDQIRSAEDLNTYIGIFESAKIIYEVNDRIQGDLKERFMAPFTDSINFGGPLTPIEVLGRDRKIIPSRMSLIINVAYTHPDPAIASEVANLFAQTFIAYNYDLNIDGSLEAVDDLKVRANQQRAVVEKLEMQLAEYRESEQAVSLDSQENIAREQLAALARGPIRCARRRSIHRLPLRDLGCGGRSSPPRAPRRRAAEAQRPVPVRHPSCGARADSTERDGASSSCGEPWHLRGGKRAESEAPGGPARSC